MKLSAIAGWEKFDLNTKCRITIVFYGLIFLYRIGAISIEDIEYVASELKRR